MYIPKHEQIFIYIYITYIYITYIYIIYIYITYIHIHIYIINIYISMSPNRCPPKWYAHTSNKYKGSNTFHF